MSRRPTWIAILPTAALLVAGCGGGGDDETTESTAALTTAPAALSKAELIERGDAICAEVNAAVGTTAASGEESGAAGQVAGLYSGMVASLKNLGTPEEADGYAEFSVAADELATAEDEVQLAAERGDTAGLEAAESNASSALTSFQNAASKYGFQECSEGPSAPVTSLPGEAGESGEAEAGEEAETLEPEAVEPEAAEPEATPEVAPEGGGVEGGGTGSSEGGGGSTGDGSSGGIGPG